jgi:undecaprenyl-diphosphatase
MFTITEAIVLAIVQGLTEFFPVSSTAHLIIIPALLHWPDPGLTFDVALHTGTLAAVLGYFFTTWIRIIRAGFGTAIDVHTGQPLSGPKLAAQRRLLWFLVIATIPGAIVGAAFEHHIENEWRSLWIITATLIAVGILMGIADRAPAQVKDFDEVSLGDSLWIGCSQALAVVPGVSRSGITITTGLFRDLTREAAARFSFLLATPIIAGAALKKGWEIHKEGLHGMGPQFAAGIIVSAIVGVIAIALFIRFLRFNSLRFFVWYRIVLGLVLAGLMLGHVIPSTAPEEVKPAVVTIGFAPQHR